MLDKVITWYNHGHKSQAEYGWVCSKSCCLLYNVVGRTALVLVPCRGTTRVVSSGVDEQGLLGTVGRVSRAVVSTGNGWGRRGGLEVDSTVLGNVPI